MPDSNLRASGAGDPAHVGGDRVGAMTQYDPGFSTSPVQRKAWSAWNTGSHLLSQLRRLTTMRTCLVRLSNGRGRTTEDRYHGAVASFLKQARNPRWQCAFRPDAPYRTSTSGQQVRPRRTRTPESHAAKVAMVPCASSFRPRFTQSQYVE